MTDHPRRPAYALVPPPAGRAPAPVLDPHQQAVVDHEGGPLLVLAGPGTGKTTTLVETVVDRIERRGLRPEQALVLTFSRKAAEELRHRIATRLDRTVATPLATTFHSFCYGLVREFQDPKSYSEPLQLLSASESDTRIRELVLGGLDDRTVPWPTRLGPALRTRGFAVELERLMTRTRALGLDPVDLAAAGAVAGRADWDAAARFFEDYLDVLDAQNLIDYAELVHRAGLVVADPEHQPALRERFPFVIVDEYQDTDPAQVAVLQALAGDGRDLVVVGDPDQSIYAFRGAEVSAILGFADAFRTREGAPAAVCSLRRTRRFGPRILAASREVARRIPLGPLAVQARAFRDPEPSPVGEGDEVWVRTFADSASEAEHLALMLRRAHLEEGLDWDAMAVLVRSGAAMPRLQRALQAAGVPVEVAGAEVPLRTEPAVAALLAALHLAVALAEQRQPDPESVERFLTGPLGDLDAAELRILCQELRRRDAYAEDGERQLPRSSRTLLVELLLEPLSLAPLVDDGGHGSRAGDVARRAYRACALVSEAARLVADHASPEHVLWTLWRGTGWEGRLLASIEGRSRPLAEEIVADHADASAAAHRDLDAVVALFALAARAEESQRRRRVAAFLDEIARHEVPVDTLAERGQRGSAVRLLTAHRSKGLEWDLVVVAGVQEGTWPDVRHRGTLLGAERLAEEAGGGSLRLPPTAAELVAEERRLFYVAVTRARRRLVVTTVQSSDPEGDQPSPFVADVARHATHVSSGPERRPRRGLSLRGVIAELRELAQHGATESVRDAAAQRLATLAATRLPAAAPADPDTWWGLREVTRSEQPVRTLDEPVRLSGSSLDAITSCSLSWFLTHEAKGEAVSSTAQGFGLLVHALAADVVQGGSAADPAALDAALDVVWDRLAYAAPWVARRERDEARAAIGRFAQWHAEQEQAARRRPLAAEHAFEVRLPVAGEEVVLRGSMDRVEVDVDGLVHVVDFKTGKRAPTGSEITEHAQLGVYQLAVEHGAADPLLRRRARSGGAELVHLRLPESAKRATAPKVQPQDAPREEDAFFAYALLEDAVRTIRTEQWVATPSPKACQFCQFARMCPAKPEGASVLDAVAPAPAAEEEAS
ncbi:ATP-dependent helicase [Mumia sp. zg.B21]|uniref:ATP-dependent helicase n=1 Tax=Mumia sp. zg.B21 TaxID=2855447 RepID=UPI001C6F1A81|nr:ATP-dependent DNA helicase [Mumia sp. zg.B21]MBW9210987.1 ATP-dependent helicase [Mumia sp. zg.B21]